MGYIPETPSTPLSSDQDEIHNFQIGWLLVAFEYLAPQKNKSRQRFDCIADIRAASWVAIS
jgi:hypothetical protein